MILITGADGFIGSSMMAAIRERRLFTDAMIGDDINVMKFNPLSPEKPTLKDDEQLQIYHFGGTPSPVKYKRDPSGMISRDIESMIAVLKFAEENDARVLFTSTIDVDKTYPPGTLRNAYIDSKRTCEDLCYIWRSNGVDARIARLYSTYGPGMRPDDGRVIPAFITAALKDRDINVIGGNQLDSFCYIDDMISAIYSVMNISTPCDPVELGNPNTGKNAGLISILDLAKMVCELVGSDSKLYVSPMAHGREAFDRIPDISYARSMYDWNPNVGLEEGLRRTIVSIRKKINRSTL